MKYVALFSLVFIFLSFAPKNALINLRRLDPKQIESSTSDASLASPQSRWKRFPHQGLNGGVNAMVAIGADLYVAGGFTGTADGKITGLHNIARFSGGRWYPLPNGGLEGASPNSAAILALAVLGDDLYVGGVFSQTADGSVTNLNNIAVLSNGVWKGLPNDGLSGTVSALAVSGNNLYVGGGFWETADHTLAMLGVAELIDGSWHSLPNGGVDGPVYCLLARGEDLYIGGYFFGTADNTREDFVSIVKFSNGTWQPLPNEGLDDHVYTLAFLGNDLYVGGDFVASHDQSVKHLNYIARLHRGKWIPLANNGLGRWVYVSTIVPFDKDLYVGGTFSRTHDGSITNLHGVAKYSGGKWEALPGDGLVSDDAPHWSGVDSILFVGKNAYFGGSFISVPTT